MPYISKNLCTISRDTIRNWLLKFNIPIRSYNEARHLQWEKKRLDISKELRKKYIDDKMTMRECAKYFDSDPTTIMNRLKEYNIPSRNVSEACKGREVWNKGEKCPQFTGSNHYNWKGGPTSINEQIRRNYFYRQWRSDVYTRDEFACQECGQISGRLHAHHIKSLSSILRFYEITTIQEALECDELWNINNGVTLCRKCHRKHHKEMSYFKNSKVVV